MNNIEDNRLEKLMAIHNFSNLNSLNEMTEILNFKKLDADGTPAIVTDKKTIIVFDNFLFNETYLLDLVNAAIDANREKFENVSKLYCDNPRLRLAVFNPRLKVPKNYGYRNIEKEILKPSIIVVNPVGNHVVILTEDMLGKINQENVNQILSWIDSDVENAVVYGRQPIKEK